MVLSERIAQINSLLEDQCWYITRQVTNFSELCYAAKILEDYQTNNETGNYEAYFISKYSAYNMSSKVHRQTNNCYYLGLLNRTSGQYQTAELTPVYFEIKSRCNGDFSNVTTYQDLLISQIEKLYISRPPLEERADVDRSAYKIHPAFFLSKILLSLGDITGDYSITLSEFQCFVGTSFNYTYYISTIELILESRNSNPIVKNIISDKYNGNRVHLLLSNLPYLEVTSSIIKFKNEYIESMKFKLAEYETNLKDEYFSPEFLNSTKTLTKGKIDHDLNDVNTNAPDIQAEYSKSVYCEDYDLSILDNIPRNKIYYGAPGTGKSFKLRDLVLKELKFKEKNITRVTFHPSYSYQQFVGSYKPTPIYKTLLNDPQSLYKSDKKSILDGTEKLEPLIDYAFVPGPFLELLIEAIKAERRGSNCNYMLIIEEINRANVASVFGDVFQLLDRKDNFTSEYDIDFNNDVRNYLVSKEVLKPNGNEKIGLPKNFFIWATMNNADQGVMPLDSAFKRRWAFKYIGINDAEKEPGFNYSDRLIKFRDKCYNWNQFRKEINSKLKENNVNEDKFLGFFYMNENELKDKESIKNKLLLYLREDVLRHNSHFLFPEKSFSDIVEKYDDQKCPNENVILLNWDKQSGLKEIICPPDLIESEDYVDEFDKEGFPIDNIEGIDNSIKRKPRPAKSIDEHFAGTTAEFRNFFNTLKERIENFGGVNTRTTFAEIIFEDITAFASMAISKNGRIRVYLRTNNDQINDPLSLTTKIPETNLWGNTTRKFFIDIKLLGSKYSIDNILDLIEQSYNSNK
jgi:predicted transport protein